MVLRCLEWVETTSGRNLKAIVYLLAGKLDLRLPA
jgi:hypothetical protein